MSLRDAIRDACRQVGIQEPRSTRPGAWAQCPVDGKAKSNRSGRVYVFRDERGGIAWNWVTGQSCRFTTEGAGDAAGAPLKRDREADRRQAEERAEVGRIADAMVRAAETTRHPYLVSKGFPDEIGLVLDRPEGCLPANALGERLRRALPDGERPFLLVPGRIGRRVVTVQFITCDGAKKNILGGAMGGAAHRIATGRETWVCEGIATALSVRAALRLLNRSATVLSAFSAQNVAKVASGLGGSIIAADHDRPLEQLGGLGTGEFYARAAGRQWVQPPQLGDWNDLHQAEGLRAVAMALREVKPP